MTSLLQPSFTGGELAPALYGRVDLARYATSVRTMKNWIVLQYGGACNRPGWQFIAEAKDSTKRARLLPFQFNTTQTYVLEFGNQYMRIIKDAGQIESGGVPYEIATPYLEADLPLLKFTQSADVMTICHPDYAPRQLSRTAHDAWTLGLFAFKNGPFQTVNVDTAVAVYASATSGSVTLEVTGGNIFTAAHVGSLFYIEDAAAHTVKPWAPGQIGVALDDQRRSDGKVYRCSAISGGTSVRTGGTRPIHSEGKEWDGDGYDDGTYTNGIEWEYLHSGFGILQITAVTDGNTATATVLSRLPTSVAASATKSYKWAFGAWGGDQGYPGSVTYYQERQVFAGTPAQPQDYWMSRTGDYVDYGISTPTADDDAISRSIPGRQVNAIRHLLPLDRLVFFTSGSEYVTATSFDDPLTPTTISTKPQSYRGSAQLPPLVIGNVALYLQEKGSVVRDIGYEYESDSYTGGDLTILSAHLFEGYQLEEWAFTQVPWSVVWCVRDDGVLLGLTYMREQQVLGWHWHETAGSFESVCSVSEGTEDALYAIIKRTINGVTKRYIERMHTRRFDDIADAFFVDSGLTYDGRNQAGTLTLSGGTSWGHDETFTASLSGAAVSLSASSVGDAFVLTDGAQKVRLVILAVAGAATCTVRANREVPAAMRGANTVWDYAIRDVGGLDHLEGEAVAILADGNVVSNVQDAPAYVVASGVVTLPSPSVVVHVGLPYECDLETLDVSVPNEVIIDKKKIIHTLRMLVEKTRGLRAGPDATNLYEEKLRSNEGYDEPTAARTGLTQIPIKGAWVKTGRVLIRQSEPLPATVLAVIPDVSVGGA